MASPSPDSADTKPPIPTEDKVAAQPADSVDTKPPAPPEDDKLLEILWSFIVVTLIAFQWWFRATVIGRLAPPILVVLSIVELIGALMHAIPLLGPLMHGIPVLGLLVHGSPPTELAITGLLISTAVILVYHHSRLEVRISRLDTILAALGPLLDAESLRPRGQHNGLQITAILDALVVVAQFRNRNVTAYSTIVKSQPHSESSQEPFKIVFQDSKLHFDPSSVCLDREKSVAGTLQQNHPLGTLLYVPNTRYKHAIKIERVDSFVRNPNAPEQPTRNIFRYLNIVPSAFQIVRHANQSAVRSLLCVAVPFPDGGEKSCGILCLSFDRPRRMGNVEFSAIKWAAALIAPVLRDSMAAVHPQSSTVTGLTKRK